jgi:ABC-type uncharacterized transport system substrate-binding protein
LLSDQVERVKDAAAELLALQPDLIIAVNTPDVSAVLSLTKAVPIVFVNPADPIGSGFIASLARPGGNATGTTGLTVELISKRLEMLLYVVFDPLTVRTRRRIAELALEYRAPAVYESRDYVLSGGLLSYTYLRALNFERAADFVDKILKGAKPADLAVEQPTKFELVINLGTAKALGLTVPPTLLVRADEVIE